MARVTGADAVYEAADLFRQRCLIEGRSFLWPEHPAWTIATIDALVDAFMGHADYGNRTFLEKLHDQLAEQPDDVLRVAADVLAFYFLFPGPETVGREKKLESIQAIVDWRPESLRIAPSERSMLETAFAQGIGNTGTYFLSGRPWHLAFFLAFARGVIEGRADPKDAASCKRLIDELKLELDGRVQSRHILLHLLFPDQFEPIASESHKQKIVATFQKDAGGAQDLDDALVNIRRALTERFERADLSFYDPDIRELWSSKPTVKKPPINKVLETTGTQTYGVPGIFRWWIEKTKMQGEQY
jgi:5-methylcytosine-specific restriction protein B